MNPRHAAALALIGWYLMTPPVVRSGLTTAEMPTAPKSKWEIWGKFNTPHECETARSRFLSDPNNRVFYAAEASGTAQYHSAAKRKIEADCISTDDPSLKAK